HRRHQARPPHRRSGRRGARAHRRRDEPPRGALPAAPGSGSLLRGSAVSMDIEEFYDQDPRRRASDEIEFGREWSENDRQFEVSWVADTGELYVMAEPYSRREISTESVTVELLGVVNGRDAINSALAGWQEAMAQPNSLAWVRERLAAASGSG